MSAAARIIAIVSVLLAGGGCAQHQSTAKILVSDGCIVTIEGLSLAQATGISKDWEFGDDCTLKAATEIGVDE